MKDVRNIAVLGSTGSIGRNALEVVSSFPDRFRVTHLTANRNIDLLKEQVKLFRPRTVVVHDHVRAAELALFFNGALEVLTGEEGLCEIVQRADVDLVVSSLVGFAGLKPTLRAIEAGKDIALANKETLVAAGEIVMRKVREHGVALLPVDSEHSAILQCLRGEGENRIERLILTASGGPFLHMEKSTFDGISVAQALNHPTWKMGSKITIDSATLMNKGLEVIEAFWLFGIPWQNIEVVIHPQSIIHSMVEFADGSMKAQMGIPDMRIPIQYALMYPGRPHAPYRRINFDSLRDMTFLRPDMEKFRCLRLAYHALQAGGTAPAVLNAANEIAVQMFLEERISFAAIPGIVEEALEDHSPIHDLTLETIEHVDAETRTRTRHHAASLL